MKVFKKYVSYRSQPGESQKKKLDEIRDEISTLYNSEKMIASSIGTHAASLSKMKVNKAKLERYCTIYYDHLQKLREDQNKLPPQPQEPLISLDFTKSESQFSLSSLPSSSSPSSSPAPPLIDLSAPSSSSLSLSSPPPSSPSPPPSSPPQPLSGETIEELVKTLEEIKPKLVTLETSIQTLESKIQTLLEKKSSVKAKRVLIEKELAEQDPNYISLQDIAVQDVPDDLPEPRKEDKQRLL